MPDALVPSVDSIFVEHTKQLISDNPIIIQSIIEPSVNELISDSDIPKMVQDHARSEMDKVDITLLIKDFISSLLEDQFTSSESINDMINDNIINKIESANNGSNIEARIEELIQERVDNVNIDDNTIQESIDERVDDLIQPSSYEFVERVKESIDNILNRPEAETKIARCIELKTGEIVNDIILGCSTTNNTQTLISNKIEQLITPQHIQSAIEKYLTCTDGLELLKKMNPDCGGNCKCNSEDLPIVQESTTTITIKVKTVDVDRIYWLLQKVVDNTGSIQVQ
jgi:hypothetical protein